MKKSVSTIAQWQNLSTNCTPTLCTLAYAPDYPVGWGVRCSPFQRVLQGLQVLLDTCTGRQGNIDIVPMASVYAFFISIPYEARSFGSALYHV